MGLDPRIARHGHRDSQAETDAAWWAGLEDDGIEASSAGGEIFAGWYNARL
jgi:hypothetical protein